MNKGQLVYTSTIAILEQAREKGVSGDIRSALRVLLDELVDLTEHATLYTELAPFIIDEKMLFATNREILSNSGPDVLIKTSGLIDQMLEMIGVHDHEKLSGTLSEALHGLHADLSKGVYDVHKQKAAIITAIENIRPHVE